MSHRLLLATDLDGTLLPDGRQLESKRARDLFGTVVARPEVTLAFVTGRHRALVEQAIDEFSLPLPDLVIADVGTTVYEVRGGDWSPWKAWREELLSQWATGTASRLAKELAAVPGLRLQEAAKQAEFKVSFYIESAQADDDALARAKQRLASSMVQARLIFSRDRQGTGLLDVVPRRAGKLAALECLIEERGIEPERVVFAGDSGNDLEVLASRMPSILVANADPEVQAQAIEMTAAAGNLQRLYLAHGGLAGMNGNYAAGILEGLVHFVPEASGWLR